MKKLTLLLFNLLFASIMYAQPSGQITISNLTIGEVTRGESFDVTFTYNSDIDVTTTLTELVLVRNPFAQALFIGSTAVMLPSSSGMDTPGTVTFNAFPAPNTAVVGGDITELASPRPIGPAGSTATYNYQLRFGIENVVSGTNPTGITLSGGFIQNGRSLNNLTIDTIIEDTDGDGVNNLNPDGTVLDQCPNTTMGEAVDGPLDPNPGCSVIQLSSFEFTKGDVSNLVTSANPVNSSIDINASGDYTIVNLGGATVQSGSFSGTVNVENLTTGIYFLAIDGGVYKFVKS